MFDKTAVLQQLRQAKARRVLLQLPQGLLGKGAELSEWLEREGFEPVISIEPCFGACDLRDNEAKRLGCDVLLHIGHTDFGMQTEVPVIYERYALKFDPVTFTHEHGKMLRGYQKIGMVATAQYIDSLQKAKQELEKQGHAVIIPNAHGLGQGQVLGCDYSGARSIDDEVDCFLFLGSGRFHPLGLVANTEKPVFFIDVEKNEMTELSKERDKLEVKRQLRIEKARAASNFAIFVSTKPGQHNREKARLLKKMLTGKGKRVMIITGDTLSPEKMMGMGIEVLVNTACPRIYDDQIIYRSVILNPDDVPEI